MRSTLLISLLVTIAAAAPTALPDENWTDWPNDKRGVSVRNGDGWFAKPDVASNGDPTGFKKRQTDYPGTEANGDPTGYGKRSAQSDDPNWTTWPDKRDNEAPPTKTKPIGWPPKRDVAVDIA
ncbi:MAG: hypothetical protein Q9160_001222 [Pyrenula sp. 1 TL-2023]